MKKTIMLGLASVLVVTSANAGLLETLGLKKSAEPQTLAEACDTKEIKKICPGVVMGTESMTECLASNVKSLSSKCAGFVKKSIKEKKDAAIAKVAAVKDGADASAAESKAESDARIAAKKEQTQAKIDAAKANIAANKEAVRAAGKEVADSVHETGSSVKETGAALKNLF